MALTVKQAIDQVTAKIEEKGKFSMGNILDSVIGIASDNANELQEMLNRLLKKTGVLNADEEKELAELLARQEQEKKKRQRIRLRNALFITGAITVIGIVVYLSVKKK